MLRQRGSTASIGYQIDQMDASVAPPRLITFAFGAMARMSSGRERGIQSPDSITMRSAGSWTPSLRATSTSSCISGGAEFQTVTRRSTMAASHACGV